MTWLGLRALWSHWWRNPWQLVTLMAGLALSTALWSGVQAINAEARASYASASDVLNAGDIRRVLKADGTAFSQREFIELRQLGWQVSPVLEGRLTAGSRQLRIVGIDPLNFPGALPAPLSPSAAASALATPGSLAVANPEDVAVLEQLGLDVRPDASRPEGSVLMDIADAARLLGARAELRRLLLTPGEDRTRAPLPTAFRVAAADVQADVARLTDSFHLNLTAFGLLSFAVGCFIVYSAVGLAFEQRRPVFRTLRALGVSLRRLTVLVALELGTFALLAGLMGIALGYGIAAALLPDVAATLRGLYGADVDGTLRLRSDWWLSGLGMAFGGTAVAAAGAFYRLVTMPVLSFSHPRAMSLGSVVAARNLGLVSIGLFLAGGLVVVFGNGLAAGFAILACLLLGAAFGLPWMLAVILRHAENLSGSARTKWFWADTKQQLGGLSMALMALMLAMAANVGVSTMVSSFRLTFSGYLDQRLSAELYLRANSVAQANEIEGFLLENADAILPITSVDGSERGLPVEVFGVRDHATYRESWPLLSAESDVWTKLAAGEGALVNEQMARKLGLSLGDLLGIGEPVIGIYSDYGNATGQVILGESLFAERYPDAERLRFGVRTPEPDALAADLRARFDLGEDALINQKDLKALSMQIFERTFSVTAALNVLTLGVAALAILICLLTLATMRLPQLAPVWALGMTRASLAKLELLRAGCLAALTCILALPAGIVLAWVLLNIVNVEAFGWRLPMFLFPADYARLACMTLLAACLAALWPAIQLARMDPQRLLRTFSNER